MKIDDVSERKRFTKERYCGVSAPVNGNDDDEVMVINEDQSQRPVMSVTMTTQSG
jgi:hypothetical protein